MELREKVSLAVAHCLRSNDCSICEACPYNEGTDYGCRARLRDDIIELLKAQESVEPTVEHNPAGQPMWCCGNCGTTLFFKLRQMTDDEEKRNEHRFCHYCGRAVKWND